jgi:hypothetical protein
MVESNKLIDKETDNKDISKEKRAIKKIKFQSHVPANEESEMNENALSKGHPIILKVKR